jgi:EpsI family protein
MSMSLRHLVLAAAFLGTYALTHTLEPVAPAQRAAIARIPMTLSPWNGVTAPPLSAEVMKTLGADEYIRRWYRTGTDGTNRTSRVVEMDVSYYAQPRVGATMHSPLNCLPGTGWRIVRVDTRALPGQPDVHVRLLEVQRRTRRFAMAYWFQSRDRSVADEGSTRLRLLADALQRRPTAAGLVRVMAPADGSHSADDAVLAFAATLLPELRRVLSI